MKWGRLARSVKELRVQAPKPKADAPPARGSASCDGVIRRWLLLGPLPLKDGVKEEDTLPHAAAVAPDKGDKAGDLTWRAINLDVSIMDLCALLNVPPNQKGYAAYACTYLFSPSGRPVACNFFFPGQGTNRAWLNGKAVYVGSRDLDIAQGSRLVLRLQKGWNRLMIFSAKTVDTRKSWWMSASLFGDKGCEYDAHGIVWMTPLPAPGASAPVLVGERIFFTAETGSLVCVNKVDGKPLWVRSLTYYDFATDPERKANPGIFAKLDAAAAEVKQLDQSDTVVPWKPPALEKHMRSRVERRLFRGMAKVSRKRYGKAATWGCEGGFTPCAPVTDGRHVYTLFGTGIVACYDRDGNRLWKRLLKRATVEHGYTTSPLLVDGKLVVYFDHFTVLDSATGRVVLERPHFVPGGGKTWSWYNHFHGTGCLLPAGGESVLYFLNGEFVRLSDGASLPIPANTLKTLKPVNYTGGAANRIATPVVDGGIAYKITRDVGGVVAFRLPSLQAGRLNPEVVREIPFTTDQFPYYYNPIHCASPLLHEGLLYCLNDFGVLTVVDVAKGQVLYQRLLDLDIFMPYS
ncbi:MAG TPA: PQQ-binding-like beta-propeller repeat protein, partial [Phycisphaerae bacterium]|nr:PQQ-binding-like beta-propeller repeat protein [Phycisphaerae bacterium]